VQRNAAFFDLANVTSTNIGVLYAVLLAFIFVRVQDKHNSARALVDNETTLIGALWRDAKVFPEVNHQLIRQRIEYFVEHTIHVEWPAMKKGNYTPHYSYLQKIWGAYYAF